MFAKIISFFMSIAMFFCSLLGIDLNCGSKTDISKEIQYSEDNKAVIVVIEENPTTGYRWNYRLPNDGIVILVKDEYIAPEQNGATGVPGARAFTFKAARPGKTEIPLSYERNWEDGAADTAKIVITVAEDLTLTAEVIR